MLDTVTDELREGEPDRVPDVLNVPVCEDDGDKLDVTETVVQPVDDKDDVGDAENDADSVFDTVTLALCVGETDGLPDVLAVTV